MSEERQIAYGWHPNERPHYPDGAGLAPPKHVHCDRCAGLLTKPPRRATS